jgi:hypothetical protein
MKIKPINTDQLICVCMCVCENVVSNYCLVWKTFYSVWKIEKNKTKKQRPKYQIWRSQTTYNFECVYETIGKKWPLVHDVAEWKGEIAMHECKVSSELSEDISVHELQLCLLTRHTDYTTTGMSTRSL